MKKRTDAQSRADRDYEKKIVRVVVKFNPENPDDAQRLEKLALTDSPTGYVKRQLDADTSLASALVCRKISDGETGFPYFSEKTIISAGVSACKKAGVIYAAGSLHLHAAISAAREFYAIPYGERVAFFFSGNGSVFGLADAIATDGVMMGWLNP